MAIRKVEFKTLDGVTLRGIFFEAPKPNAPVVIMTADLNFLKDHFITTFASCFQSADLASLAYSH
jgi:hypothetical protein